MRLQEAINSASHVIMRSCGKSVMPLGGLLLGSLLSFSLTGVPCLIDAWPPFHQGSLLSFPLTGTPCLVESRAQTNMEIKTSGQGTLILTFVLPLMKFILSVHADVWQFPLQL